MKDFKLVTKFHHSSIIKLPNVVLKKMTIISPTHHLLEIILTMIMEQVTSELLQEVPKPIKYLTLNGSLMLKTNSVTIKFYIVKVPMTL